NRRAVQRNHHAAGRPIEPPRSGISAGRDGGQISTPGTSLVVAADIDSYPAHCQIAPHHDLVPIEVGKAETPVRVEFGHRKSQHEFTAWTRSRRCRAVTR